MPEVVRIGIPKSASHECHGWRLSSFARRYAIMMKVAIVGATGRTSIYLVAELRKTSAAVRVVARGMDKLARPLPKRQGRRRKAP